MSRAVRCCDSVRRSWFSTLLLLACLFPLVAPEAQGALLSDPKRVVNGQTVDLSPLFRWWTNHNGSRPLGSWVRVRGTIVGTNSIGWVISGQADKSHTSRAEPLTKAPENSSTGRLLLKNPPVEDAAHFEQLREQLKEAEAAKARIQNDSAAARAQEAQVQTTVGGRARRRAVAQLHSIEKADKALGKNLDVQISELKQKLHSFPNPDYYEVVTLALDTGAEYHGLEVYDRGRPLR